MGVEVGADAVDPGAGVDQEVEEDLGDVGSRRRGRGCVKTPSGSAVQGSLRSGKWYTHLVRKIHSWCHRPGNASSCKVS